VLLGTLYPLILDALNAGKISVGPPYFDAVFLPLMAPLVFLMGIGPIASWHKATLPDLWTRLKWALGVALSVSLLLPFVLGRWSPLVAFGLFLALWVVASTVALFVRRIRAAPQRDLRAKLRANSAAWYGMMLAHLGVAVFIIGVTLVSGYGVERDVPLGKDETVAVAGYNFTFRGVAPITGPNYRGLAGLIEMRRDGELLKTLRPEKRVYHATGATMTEAAIDAGFFGDRYVSLGEPVTDQGIDGAWGVRIYVKPFVDWIWGGCALMAFGGFLALTDRRYRLAVQRQPAALSGAARAA